MFENWHEEQVNTRTPQDVDVLAVLDLKNPCWARAKIKGLGDFKKADTRVSKVQNNEDVDVLWSPGQYKRSTAGSSFYGYENGFANGTETYQKTPDRKSDRNQACQNHKINESTTASTDVNFNNLF